MDIKKKELRRNTHTHTQNYIIENRLLKLQ